MNKIRPFLKWAGGKYELVEKIASLLPQDKKTLIEPFVGSGVVFLNTNYQHYILNDINCDLITLYKILKDKPDTYIDDVKPFFSGKYNDEKKYYQLREKFNKSQDPYERSVLFLVLNRHCYNGLTRYNNSHQFNVPFGKYKSPYFPQDELYAFSEKSVRARFTCQDFQKAMSQARSSSAIYCDPPYVPLSASAKFTSYSAGGFDLTDQERLVEMAWKKTASGVPVLISNHDTTYTKKIYKSTKREYLDVRRSISSKATERKRVREVLALFEPTNNS